MSEAPIVVTATLRSKSGCADELEQQLRADAALRAAEPGNVAYVVARSERDDHEFQLIEIYADADALAEHRRLTRLPDDPHRARIAELVENISIVRGGLVFGSADVAQDRSGSERPEAAPAPNGRGRTTSGAPDPASPESTPGPYPLGGLRVLDLSRVVAGPFAGRMLSDLGADVVKVEGPEGDVSRVWGEVRNGASGFYAQQNAGKRNISIDLKAPGAVELVLQLAAKADIVIENFRPGVMDRLGLGWEELSARHPSLILLSISGWGQTSEGDRRAFAPVVHAQSGIIARQAIAFDIPPTDPLVAIADFDAGLHGLVALLAAVHLRDRTGLGQHIDIAMLDSMLATDHYSHHYIDGSPFQRLGGYIWDAPDGPILLAADERHTWKLLSRTFSVEDPAPPGSDLATKITARRAAIASWMTAFPTRKELVEALDRANLIHSDILTSEQAFSGPDVAERGVVAEVGDGAGGPRGVVQSPYRFSNASSGVRGPAPAYGEHNATVLAEWLGLDGADLDALMEQDMLRNDSLEVGL